MNYKKWLKKLEEIRNKDYDEFREDDGGTITPNKLKAYNRTFIKTLQDYLMSEDKINFDLNSYWSDGYFIFNMGEDSVFITESSNNKDWRFGFWFDSIKRGDEEFYRVRAFAQPILTIDKFKPTASNFSDELLIPMSDLKNEALLDYIEVSDIYDMIKYIVKNPTDSLYCDWFYHDKYYRLPNKLKTWWKVFRFKYRENRRNQKQQEALVECCKFIFTKIKPLFSKEKCNAELEVEYRDFMSPAFLLRIKTCDKFYTAKELNERLICTYAHYLIEKWNLYVEKKYRGIFTFDCHLDLDYCFISDEGRKKGLLVWGSISYMSLEKLKKELENIKKQFGVAKQCVWLDLEV